MKEYRTNVMICAGTNCVSNGSLEIKAALEEELIKRGLEEEVLVVPTGCNGFCATGPIMIVQPDGIFYQQLKVEEVPYLVEEHFLKGRPVERLMYVPPEEKKPIPKMNDIVFFRDQRLIALRNRGMIDPAKIEEYIGRDGYKALAKALTSMSPEEVLEEIKISGLRGRGGAGFPTGIKWELARMAKGEPKYVICNADEGDPGAFMDRSIIEADPHSILEGMTIGAYAIGASQGHVYIRIEYPLAIKRLEQAIEQARDYGLLGEDILGSGFNFDVELFCGAGAFVCGEETSLIASIEGKVPEPRVKPPYPAQSGLWGKPTNINNVETWANVPVIINWGAKWFSEIGTEKSKGTKVFSLAGKINNAGLVEVPMGITLRKMIYEIGGGIPNGKRFKAVQTGGPSGGCIPESLLDLPVDYEELTMAGSIMGSGGMIVMDEDDCVVDIAKYFLRFTNEESCGRCTSCREGSEALLEVLTRISEGEGREGDLEFLEELSLAIKDSSLCGLGQTLPNPVLSTLRHFGDEYKAHLKYKRCPAVVCKGIISSACQHTCPLGQDVTCYIGLIAQEKLEEAVKIVRKENPFPAICGRVCHHPCEIKCLSGEIDQPIAIRALKRFLADYEQKQGIKVEEKPAEKRAERVAIIGAGPAGLTCAHYLALEGYQVTIFEALSVVGGMLRVGIPEYRLPRKVLDSEIERIKNLGVEIRTNMAIGKDIQFSDLKSQGYKAIFIAIGAHKGLKMGIPGEEAKGVVEAIEFLREVNLGEKVEIGEKIVIIGGGNAAVDAARTAKRLGKDVRIVYRRTRQEMPAAEEEIEAVIQEEIPIDFLAAPVKIKTTNGKLEYVECVRMRLEDVDESGRRRPVPIEGSEFKIEVDTLIPAIGQQPDISFLNGNGLKVSKWNTIEVDAETFYTTEEGVFAGGDVVTGPKTVTDAMAAGKTAAKMMHKYLQGEEIKREYEVTRPAISVAPIELTDEELEKLERPSIPSLPVSERIDNFKEVEVGYTKEMAIQEARRCLRCDLEKAVSY